MKINKKNYLKTIKQIFELDKEANEEKMEMFIRRNDIKIGI